MIVLCPVGKLWSDVLEKDPASEERHALAMLDAFSPKRYDVYWTPKPAPDKIWDSTHRRAGCTWKELYDSAGAALVVPLKEAAPFCVVGDASGLQARVYETRGLTFNPHGGNQWGSGSWANWPNGWANAWILDLTADLLQKYPSYFSPAGVDFRYNILPFPVQERGIYYSLMGVGDTANLEAIRTVARRWLEKGTAAIIQPDSIADLPAPVLNHKR